MVNPLKKWIRSWFRSGASPQQVRETILAFVEGRGGAYDWDDFLSFKQVDPQLEDVRRRCAAIEDQYPRRHPREWTNEEGRVALRGIAAELAPAERATAGVDDWRKLPYGKQELALVPESLRAASWQATELTLPLDEALEAVGHFRQAGVRTVAWENLHGYPGRQIGGSFKIEGQDCIYGHSPDYGIDEVADAMRAQDAELRPLLEPSGECLLFCLMVMDEVE